ncbi:UNVERIFIED_CONTAM: Non-specific lipid-transfer protein [Sesamum angustifolium]|uniref:Non-specific lipid-transfer protein n=1 Tax=Sesamum angustifolium TaxID=2727405 RepID=A0AAW2N3L9_9LAMI
MAGSGSLKLACLLILCLVVTVPHAEAAISCGFVLTNLSPCFNYIKSGGALPPACCSGAKSLNNAASTTPDLQAVCSCIKNFLPSVGANPAYFNSIPSKMRGWSVELMRLLKRRLYNSKE